MDRSLTLRGFTGPRIFSFLSGLGMMAASIMTVNHFFEANYPATIFAGAFCDVSAFFNCDSSAYSPISQILGVPLGYFGLVCGLLVCLGALLPSVTFERTNMFISLANALGVVTLFLYSVFGLGSLCLLCSGFYLFSLLNFFLFWRYGIDGEKPGLVARFGRPSIKLLAIFAVVGLAGAYGFRLYHEARKSAQSGTAMTVVRQFFELPKVAPPSFLSPCWTAKATDNFEDAAIQVVEYVDLLCPDCFYLSRQLDRLKKEFAGKINIVFQFFPLESKCNSVVDKNLHPGACDLSLIAAYDPAKFPAIHDEVFANFRAAKKPEWRLALARKYGVEAALTDPATQALLQKIIATGAEYEKTSDKYAHGIRSTPTMIINGRMLIGTLPYDHLRAIFQVLVEEREGKTGKFIENWVPVPKKALR